MSERCRGKKAKIVALLHDTIEDTFVTADYLKEYGFSNDVIEAVLALSRQENETYAQFIMRASKNEIAKEVKISDLEDNLDVRRLDDITENTIARERKYLHAWRFLKGLEPDTSLIR